MSPCGEGCVTVELPPGWGSATLHAAEHVAGASDTHRSYDQRGRQLVWTPPAGARCACDVEDREASAEALGRRFGCDEGELPLRWILTETLAKLADTPVLAHLRERGLETVDAALGRRGVEIVVRRVKTDDGEVLSAFGRVSRKRSRRP